MSISLKIGFGLIGSDRELIRGDLHVPQRLKLGSPVVVYCHGFKGFKDWGFHPHLCSKLAEAGIPTVAFNTSHNGIGEDLLNFTRLDLFSRNTPNREQNDLATVLEALRDERLGHEFAGDRYVLVGHSRGTSMVYPLTARTSQVCGVISLAGISTTRWMGPEIEEQWRKDGELIVVNARTKQEMPLALEVLDDIVAKEHQIEESVRALKVPMLVIHGEQDASVPIHAAEHLLEWGGAKADKLILPTADHVFNCTHPFAGSTPELDQVIERCISFVGCAA